MARAPFQLGEHTIMPGQRLQVDVPVARLYTHTPLHIPVEVVHGRKDGPVLLVCGGIHGDEINGVEIVRRVLRAKAINSIRGTLIAVPVVNVFGFLQQTRYLPDRRDLNRCFPGSESGSLTCHKSALNCAQAVKPSVWPMPSVRPWYSMRNCVKAAFAITPRLAAFRY